MRWLHEVHQLAGRHEDEFEALYRREWIPAVAALGGARVLYYLKQAHGSGPSYRVVTVTALAPGGFEELADAVDHGPLRALSQTLDGLRHQSTGKLLEPLPWSPWQSLELATVPLANENHGLGVFMEDTVWPYAGGLERYIEAAGSHYAAELEEREREQQALLQIQGAFRTSHGAGARREVVLWQKVVDKRALSALFAFEVPAPLKQPGTWMHDALALRDQWESRLLRSTSWSPLY